MSEVDPRLVALSNLLLVERDARRAESPRDLFFIIANDTHRVLPYRFAFVWELGGDSAVPVQASNVSELDPNAPMVRWLREMAPVLRARNDERPAPLVQPDAPEALREPWLEFAAPYGLNIPLNAPDGTCLGGLFLSGDEPWSDAQLLIAERLADAYGHAWWARRPKVTADAFVHLRRYRRRYLAAVAVLLLLPVRQYVLVPAEVVPRDPFVVAAPMSGVVTGIDVAPNATVTRGTQLFHLEDTDLANEWLVAQRALDVAEAEYLKNAQDAFSCDSCRARVPELRAAADKARAQAEWSAGQLERSRVRAPVDGTTVFSDPNEWRGRPVSVGERVMVLARPDDTRLRLAMPIADAIAIEPGTGVVFHPNASPLSTFDGTVVQTSYEATQQPDQSLGYVLFADFAAGNRARLGLRGTAKVYGARAPILFHALRRPLAWLRRTLGL